MLMMLAIGENGVPIALVMFLSLCEARARTSYANIISTIATPFLLVFK